MQRQCRANAHLRQIYLVLSAWSDISMCYICLVRYMHAGVKTLPSSPACALPSHTFHLPARSQPDLNITSTHRSAWHKISLQVKVYGKQ